MLLTDKTAFAAIIAKTWRFYDKTPTGETLSDWFDVLEGFPLETIATAFKRHITDPKSGQFVPKPADIIRQLQAHQPDDDSGHPGPEEAWGMLNRLLQDEGETGVLTEEMREAWSMCDPILDMGDEVGARMCFLETYRKAVARAKESRLPTKWSPTMGTDVERRKTALKAAVEARRISADYAQSLLPAPVASLEHLAGLLEHDGPKPEPGQPSYAERLRSLIVSACAGSTDRDPVQAEPEEPVIEADWEEITPRIAAYKAGMLLPAPHEAPLRRAA